MVSCQLFPTAGGMRTLVVKVELGDAYSVLYGPPRVHSDPLFHIARGNGTIRILLFSFTKDIEKRKLSGITIGPGTAAELEDTIKLTVPLPYYPFSILCTLS